MGNPISTGDKENWNKFKDTLGLNDRGGGIELGPYYGYSVRNDIKHFGITIARYKFVSKLMLYRKQLEVLELGCQEAIGTYMFKQNNALKRYVAIDLDEECMRWNENNLSPEFEFIQGNFFDKELFSGEFDLVFSLDVIEHIESRLEDDFLEVAVSHMKNDGTCIVGTPSYRMNEFASDITREVHINMYSQQRLYDLMSRHFRTVYIFNMNDEVVNVGFAPMSCYIFAVGSGINK